MAGHYGEEIILRRVGRPNVDVTCAATVVGHLPHELGDDIAEGDRKVRISNMEIANSGWPGPPQRGDQVIVQGKTTTIQDVNTTTHGGFTLMHMLRTRE